MESAALKGVQIVQPSIRFSKTPFVENSISSRSGVLIDLAEAFST